MGATSLAHAVDAALTPDLALRYLRELAADLVAGAVLRPGGARLAGPEAVAHAAARILADAGAVPIAQIGHAGHLVSVACSAGHALVVVHTRHALPGLVRHDLRTVLGDLAPDGRPPTEAAPVTLAVAPHALDVLVAAAATDAASSGQRGRTASGSTR